MSKMIYVVEDYDNLRDMLKIALVSFSYDVVTFDNAEKALEAIQENMPDMVILDIMLTGMSGIEATQQLRHNSSTRNLPIIIISARDTELDKVEALDNGADDYLTKPFGILELGARIRSIFRYSNKTEEQVFQNIIASDLVLNINTREVTQDTKFLDLSYKEFELLLILIKECERVVHREELLNLIWGFDFIGESRTLDVHVNSLRKKLNDNAENPKYIKTVRNVGYRFVGKKEKV